MKPKPRTLEDVIAEIHRDRKSKREGLNPISHIPEPIPEPIVWPIEESVSGEVDEVFDVSAGDSTI